MMGGRRLASAATAVVLALGGTLIAATPAQAWDQNCQIWVGVSYEAGSYITGYRVKTCDHKPDQPLPVTVERYLSPGNYQVVASGIGEATYYCQGWAYNVFQVTGTGPSRHPVHVATTAGLRPAAAFGCGAQVLLPT
jgi:hypothetical protein